MSVDASEFGSKTRSQAHADRDEIYCNNEDNILFRLAYLITGDEAQAQDSIIAAYGLAEHGETPFRDWLLEWALYATAKSAIEARLAEIRKCEDRYKSSDRKPPTHRPQVMRPDLPAMTESDIAPGSRNGYRWAGSTRARGSCAARRTCAPPSETARFSSMCPANQF